MHGGGGGVSTEGVIHGILGYSINERLLAFTFFLMLYLTA